MQNEVRFFNELKEKLLVDGQNFLYAGQLLKRAYEQFPSNIALIASKESMTYRELYLRSVLFSLHLQKLGIKPGERVVLLCENSAAFYNAYFAILQVGAVVIPLNTFLHEKELTYIVNDAKPAAIVVTDALRKKVDALVQAQQISESVHIIGQQEFDCANPLPSHSNTMVASFEPVALPLHGMCALLYTSGTTGTPKGVMLSSNNVITNTLQVYARFRECGLGSNERFFCVLPLFHVFAQNTCLWLPVMVGGSIIIVSHIDRSLILEGLRHKPTVFFGVPALYGLLCLMKTAPLDSVRLFVSGADMLPAKIRVGFGVIYGRKICSGYGLSETSPVIAVNTENNEKSTMVVGYPLVGIEAEVRDEQRNVLPVGTIGELWLKGDNVMLGYYNAPEQTNKVFVDGWLNSGDLAYKDALGRLAICGRTKDVIIHKGFNIYPAEVENVLLLHPAVSKVAVIGHDEGANGQVPVAFVAVKKHDDALEKDLRALCAHNLAAYKVPRKIICLDDLPMNATGKVDKKQLKTAS